MTTEEAAIPCEFALLLLETHTDRTSLSRTTKAEEALPPSLFLACSSDMDALCSFPPSSKPQGKFLYQPIITYRKYKSSCCYIHSCIVGKALPFLQKKLHLQKCELGHVSLCLRLFNSLLIAFSGKFKIFNMIYKSLHDLSDLPPQLQYQSLLMISCWSVFNFLKVSSPVLFRTQNAFILPLCLSPDQLLVIHLQFKCHFFRDTFMTP